MQLPLLTDNDFQDKKVLVRCDLDTPLRQAQGRLFVDDDIRLKECLPTIKYLLDQGVEKIILISHLGRPEGRVVEELRLSPVTRKLNELLRSKFKVQSSKLQFKVQSFESYQISENIILLENLRFDPREEENDLGFAKELASLGDFYVNEAFAVSHREHSSIVGIPKFLPHCAGLRFASEVENLSKVLENPKRPLVFVIGGAKPETKLAYVESFSRIADAVLIGGTLTQNSNLKTQIQNLNLKTIIFANLIESGLDISEESIKKFEKIIRTAGTVVWNGPMGKVEEPEGPASAKASAGGGQEGTRRIGKAIANSTAFKVVGGGDTITALKKFNLIDKMDYISTGGGAMLEFLAKGSLPGIKAIIGN